MTDTSVSREFSKKYPNLPAYYRHRNTIFEISEITEDGKLVFTSRTDPQSSVTLDPERDLQKLIQEAVDQGVFVGEGSAETNPNGTVLRSEFIFELWRTLGEASEYDEEDIPESLNHLLSEAKGIAGEETYYRPAIIWFLMTGGESVSGLYTYRDLEGALTWFEVAYILYVAFGARSNIKWSKISPAARGVKTTHIIHEDSAGKKKVDLRLTSYKQSTWMKTYLKEMRIGTKYIPFPVYASFVNMLHDGIYPRGPRLVHGADGEPTFVGVNVDLSSADWMLLEVSRRDMQAVLPVIKGLFPE